MLDIVLCALIMQMIFDNGKYFEGQTRKLVRVYDQLSSSDQSQSSEEDLASFDRKWASDITDPSYQEAWRCTQQWLSKIKSEDKEADSDSPQSQRCSSFHAQINDLSIDSDS